MRITVSNLVKDPGPERVKREPMTPVRVTLINQISLLEVYHALWKEVHETQDPTPEWFEDWVSRVPSAGCGCLAWLRAWLNDNPPDYDNWYIWTVKLHNAVNLKKGKPIWPL